MTWILIAWGLVAPSGMYAAGAAVAARGSRRRHLRAMHNTGWHVRVNAIHEGVVEMQATPKTNPLAVTRGLFREGSYLELVNFSGDDAPEPTPID